MFESQVTSLSSRQSRHKSSQVLFLVIVDVFLFPKFFLVISVNAFLLAGFYTVAAVDYVYKFINCFMRSCL